jgi:hypothetical protein
MDLPRHRGTTVVDAATVAEARMKSYERAEAAWHRLGWPRRPPTAYQHRQLEQCLTWFVQLSFPGKLSDEDVRELVRQTLEAFMPLLHARGLRWSDDPPGPTDLLDWLTNACLDLLQCPVTTKLSCRPSRTLDDQRFIRPSSVAQDEDLTSSLLNADPATVRAGLKALQAEGHVAEFLIITQYLDLAAAHPGTRPRLREVTARLDHRRFRGRTRPPPITERDVEHTLLNFQNRLQQVK